LNVKADGKCSYHVKYVLDKEELCNKLWKYHAMFPTPDETTLY